MLRGIGPITLAVSLGAGAALPALAQSAYPVRTVTVLVGYPPGGPTDLYIRALAKVLAVQWNQAVVVENRAGASGSLAGVQMLRAPADGHTLLFTNNAANGAYELLNPKNAPYRTTRDFAPVALFGLSPSLMVIRASLPAKDAREFVALAKASPGKLTYGSSAIGSSPHLASELFQGVAGIQLLHVPYSGAGPVIQALLGESIDMYIGGASTVMPHVRSGKLRAIGAVHVRRLHAAPDVPTMSEQGMRGVEYASWFGTLAAAATPVPLLDQMNAEFRKAMDTPEMKKQVDQFGIDYQSATRAQFLEIIQEEIDRTSKLIAEGKVKPE